MNGRKLLFAAYVATVIAAGAALLVATWLRSAPPLGSGSIEPFVFWFFLSLAAECFWLDTPSRAGMISMSLAVNIATLFILPPAYVFMIAGVSVIVSDLLLHRRTSLRAYFNASQTVLSMGVSLAVMHLVSGASPASGRIFILEHPIASLGGILTLFVLNTGLVAGVISLQGRIRYMRAWGDNFGFGYHLLATTTLAFLGLILVLASQSIGYVSGLVYLLFFFFVRDAYHRFVRTARPAVGS